MKTRPTDEELRCALANAVHSARCEAGDKSRQALSALDNEPAFQKAKKTLRQFEEWLLGRTQAKSEDFVYCIGTGPHTLRFQKLVTVRELTLPLTALQHLMPRDMRDCNIGRRCVGCGWQEFKAVGYFFYEPNPVPHTCPIGKMFEEIGGVD